MAIARKWFFVLHENIDELQNYGNVNYTPYFEMAKNAIYKSELDNEINRQGKIIFKSEVESNAIDKNKITYICNRDTSVVLLIERRRDTETKKEKQYINIRIDYNDIGSIITSLRSIDSDLLTLRDYGIVVTLPDVREIVKLIEDSYVDIKDTTAVYNTTSNWLDEIIEAVRDYIVDYGIEIHKIRNTRDEVYPIHVDDFKDFISRSDFSRIDIGSLKKDLKEKKYTRCNTGALDLQIKTKNDKQRYVAFFADKLKESIQSQEQNEFIKYDTEQRDINEVKDVGNSTDSTGESKKVKSSSGTKKKP